MKSTLFTYRMIAEALQLECQWAFTSITPPEERVERTDVDWPCRQKIRLLIESKWLNIEGKPARKERCRKMMRTRSSRDSQFRTSPERALLTRFCLALHVKAIAGRMTGL